MSQSETPVTVLGETLLSTMAELRQRIEQRVNASPQRLTLAKAYLDSLAWGINGLEAMGQKLGFVILQPNPPQEFPKMLYRGNTWVLVANPMEEQLQLSAGFSSRVVTPLVEPPTPFVTPVPPVISIALPVPPPMTEAEPDFEAEE